MSSTISIYKCSVVERHPSIHPRTHASLDFIAVRSIGHQESNHICQSLLTKSVAGAAIKLESIFVRIFFCFVHFRIYAHNIEWLGHTYRRFLLDYYPQDTLVPSIHFDCSQSSTGNGSVRYTDCHMDIQDKCQSI